MILDQNLGSIKHLKVNSNNSSRDGISVPLQVWSNDFFSEITSLNWYNFQTVGLCTFDPDLKLDQKWAWIRHYHVKTPNMLWSRDERTRAQVRTWVRVRIHVRIVYFRTSGTDSNKWLLTLDTDMSSDAGMSANDGHGLGNEKHRTRVSAHAIYR